MKNRRTFEEFLRTCIRTGKVDLGYRSTLSSIKSAKLIIYSRSLKPEQVEKLVRASKEANKPVVEFDGTSIALGRAAAKSFPILALAVRSPGDADINRFIEVVRDKLR
jgi:large subunit ribosomal protein L30e